MTETLEAAAQNPAAMPTAKGGLGGMLKNASASLIGNVLSIPLQFLGFIIAARSLGPVVFGQYSFAQELTLFVVYVADAGLNIIATREMARHRAQAGAIHGTLLRLKVFLSAGCYLVILAVGGLMSDSLSTFAAVAVLGVANLLLSYLFLASGVFRACERMVWESVTGLLQPICFCLFTAFVAYSTLVPVGLLPMALARLASFLPVVAVALVVTFRLAPPRRTPAPCTGREYLHQGLPIVLAMFAFDALLRISVLFLQAWSTKVELSMFTVSSRIVYSLWLIPYIFAGAWLPGMARSAAEHRQEEFVRHSVRLTRLVAIAAAPLAVMLNMAAEPIVLLLFGPDYRAGGPVLRVLTYCVPFLFLFYGMKTILEARNQQRQFYIIVVVGLAVGLMSNALLVPRAGALGAAWAYLAGISTSTCLGYALAATSVDWGALAFSLVRIACGATAAGLALWLLMPVSLFLALAISGIAYLLVLLLLGELNRHTLL